MHSIKTKISAITIGAIVITMIIAAVFGVVAIRIINQNSSQQMLKLLCTKITPGGNECASFQAG
jgi:hypothetical protein